VSGIVPEGGSNLERYGARFNAAEINSSFYRSHRPDTYRRWADSVPNGFRFAVKVPREITHTRKLIDALEPLDRFLCEVTILGGKLGPLLVQLPPSLVFDPIIVQAFFSEMRDRHAGAVACEPRHPTWFEEVADSLFTEFKIGRVAADPAKVPGAAKTGGWSGLAYYRLHGSPRIYYSEYPEEYLDGLAEAIRIHEVGVETWCIFDNTASGSAILNALRLQEMLGRP
jgi:uncharacterized protein YecE (DUF72 family)